MGQEHGLGMLHMGVARQDNVEITLCSIDERLAELDVCGHQVRATRFREQAGVGDDLVVARTAGMQARAGFADIGDKRLFDGHMDVLVVDVEDELPRFDAGLYAVEARHNQIDVIGGNDALGPQHARMGFRPGDILRVQRLVDRQRRTESLGEFGNVFSEPT